MKFILILIGLFATTAFGETKIYDTVCRNQNCFKDGWVTTASNGYEMKTECKLHDCEKHGWLSRANDNEKTFFEVWCRGGGCFHEGWHSLEEASKMRLYDDVTCKSADCLKYGWTVRTGYDFFGGNVTCNNNDCSKFGGISSWRGHPSTTICHAGGCYQDGWTLTIY